MSTAMRWTKCSMAVFFTKPKRLSMAGMTTDAGSLRDFQALVKQTGN